MSEATVAIMEEERSRYDASCTGTNRLAISRVKFHLTLAKAENIGPTKTKL